MRLVESFINKCRILQDFSEDCALLKAKDLTQECQNIVIGVGSNGKTSDPLTD